MIVAGLFFILACVGMIVPKGMQKIYLGFSVLTLSLLYLFFNPPLQYDLYREFDFMDFVRGMSIDELFYPSNGLKNGMLKDLQSSSKVYLIFAFFISKIGINKLLPFLVCMIIYGLQAKRISKIAKSEELSKWALSMAFITLLLTLDYRSVSGVRNMLAYSVFSFVIYEDLVLKKNRLLCFICYILLCEVHMTIAVFIVLRILVFASNRFAKPFLVCIAALSFTMLEHIQTILERFSHINFVNIFLYKSVRYVLRFDEGLAQYGNKRVAVYAFFLILMCLIYYVCKKNKSIDKKYKEYNVFFILSIALTFGAIRQYDLFIRNCMLIAFLAIPYVLHYYDRTNLDGNGTLSIRLCFIKGSKGLNFAVYLLVIAATLFIGLFHVYTFYLPMDTYFALP